MSYSTGLLVYGSLRPVAHNLEAQFVATPTTFQLTQGKLTVGNSALSLAAVLNNYNDPDVQGQYDIVLRYGKQLGGILREPAVPAGWCIRREQSRSSRRRVSALLDAADGGSKPRQQRELERSFTSHPRANQ